MEVIRWREITSCRRGWMPAGGERSSSRMRVWRPSGGGRALRAGDDKHQPSAGRVGQGGWQGGGGSLETEHGERKINDGEIDLFLYGVEVEYDSVNLKR